VSVINVVKDDCPASWLELFAKDAVVVATADVLLVLELSLIDGVMTKVVNVVDTVEALPPETVSLYELPVPEKNDAKSNPATQDPCNPVNNAIEIKWASEGIEASLITVILE
jgi:hypothetical protein